MTEISKMFENAGIKPLCQLPDEYCGMKNIYEDFTAEKQLELIKLLTQQCDLTISHFAEWEFIHFDGQEPTQVTGEDFAETFAKLINVYWQNLTNQEKEEIRNIINENS